MSEPYYDDLGVRRDTHYVDDLGIVREHDRRQSVSPSSPSNSYCSSNGSSKDFTPSAIEGFLLIAFLGILLFCIASLAVIYLVGGTGYFLLLVGSLIAFVSLSERMGWLRRGLRWAATGTWQALVATGQFLKGVAWEIREWVEDRI